MPHLNAGRSLVAFAIAMLLSSLYASIELDVLKVDLGAVIVLFLGLSVARGSVRAIPWSKAITAYYLIVACILVIATLFRPGSVGVGKHPMPPYLVYIVSGVVAAWSAINLKLLADCKAPQPSSHPNTPPA